MFGGEVRRQAPSESSRAGAHTWDGSDGERRVRTPLLGGVRAHSKRQAAVNGEGSRAAGIRHEAGKRRGERDPTTRALELGPTRREGTAQMARGRDERRGSLAACGRHPTRRGPSHQTLIWALGSLMSATSRETGHMISVWQQQQQRKSQ